MWVRCLKCGHMITGEQPSQLCFKYLWGGLSWLQWLSKHLYWLVLQSNTWKTPGSWEILLSNVLVNLQGVKILCPHLHHLLFSLPFLLSWLRPVSTAFVQLELQRPGVTCASFFVTEKWYCYGHHEVWSVRLSHWHCSKGWTETSKAAGEGRKRVSACVFSLYVCNLDLISPEGTCFVCPSWWCNMPKSD